MLLKAILFPTDFSESSAEALDYASALASQTGATLHVVHVAYDSPTYLAGYGGFEFVGDFPQQLRQEIQKRLDEVKASRPGVNLQHHYLTGSPVAEIVAFAEREEIDLIVMGTHGRTGLSRMLLGSIAEGVLRKAACPVLTIKVPEAIEAGEETEAGENAAGEKAETTESEDRQRQLSRTKFSLH